jgi:iron complex outermembrane receptor protein
VSTKNLRLKACICGVLAAALGGTSVAQERQTLLEEIVVTAQKRSETVQDAAIAITAITSETRDIVGITSIQDLTDFTPGLTYSLTQDRISLRGIGRLTNNYGSDPGVATYADGFYTASTVEAGKRPILVERTEILRGPQGTLYGRNSIGGAINVISKRPTEEFEGDIRTTVGSYKLGIMEAAFSGPITDWLRYRVAGFKGQQDEGYFEHVDGVQSEGGKYDDFYVEAQLEFDIGDAAEGWLKFSRAQWDQARRTLVTTTPYFTSPGFWNFSPCTTNPCNAFVPAITSNPAALSPNVTYNGGPGGGQLVSPQFTRQNPALHDLRKYDTDTPFHARLRDNHIVTLELVGHFGFADLKYVGGWQDYFYDQISDFDGVNRTSYTYTPAVIPVPRTVYTKLDAFYKEAKEYYSHELNLISTGDSSLQWMAGVYYYFEDVYQHQGYRSPLQAELSTPLLAAFGAPGPANPERNLSFAGANLEASALAGFGQIDWQFADQWKTTIGARYTIDKKDATEFRTRVIHDMPFVATGQVAPFPTIVPDPNGYIFSAPFYSELNRQNVLSGEWKAVTGTAGIEWRPTDDTMAFFKYSRGYKSGGFNAGAFAGTAANNYREAYTDPEHVNAFEAGLKVTMFDRLTANAALFYYDYSNAQVPLSVTDSAGLTIAQFFNFEKTESMGFELETVFAATDAWQVRLTYGLLKTKIKDERCYIDGADAWDGVSPGGQWAPDHRSCPGVPGAAQSIDGDQLPSAPEHKVGFNTNYTWNTAAGDITASATWTYRDEAYYSVFSREHYRTPSYDETDLRVLWKWPGDVLTVIGYVQNVFDDIGYERADASQSTYQSNGVPGVPVTAGQGLQVGLTPPRTIGLELQFRF